jgi:hypothetical protein
MGQDARSSKTRARKRANTSRVALKAKGKGRLWRTESASEGGKERGFPEISDMIVYKILHSCSLLKG